MKKISISVILILLFISVVSIGIFVYYTSINTSIFFSFSIGAILGIALIAPILRFKYGKLPYLATFATVPLCIIPMVLINFLPKKIFLILLFPFFLFMLSYYVWLNGNEFSFFFNKSNYPFFNKTKTEWSSQKQKEENEYIYKKSNEQELMEIIDKLDLENNLNENERNSNSNNLNNP